METDSNSLKLPVLNAFENIPTIHFRMLLLSVSGRVTNTENIGPRPSQPSIMIVSLQFHHDFSAFQKTKTHTFSLFSFTHLVSGYLVETGHKICIKDVTWLQINSAHGSGHEGHETDEIEPSDSSTKMARFPGIHQVPEPRKGSQNLFFFVGFLRGRRWFPSSSFRKVGWFPNLWTGIYPPRVLYRYPPSP